MTNTAYIIRGLPGSRKSTIATELAKAALADGRSAIIHTTDDYHMVDGEYIYKPEKASQYHALNLKAFKKSCYKGINIVIYPNTNICGEQYKEYVDCAKSREYLVHILIMDEFRTAVLGRRTQHKVPASIMHCMKRSFSIGTKYLFPEV